MSGSVTRMSVVAGVLLLSFGVSMAACLKRQWCARMAWLLLLCHQVQTK